MLCRTASYICFPGLFFAFVFLIFLIHGSFHWSSKCVLLQDIIDVMGEVRLDLDLWADKM